MTSCEAKRLIAKADAKDQRNEIIEDVLGTAAVFGFAFLVVIILA